MDKELIVLQHFFEVDTRIKSEIYGLVPPKGFFNSEESICKYSDSLNDSLIYIFNELKSISLELFGEKSAFLNKIVSIEQQAKQDFYNCGLDIKKLRLFYQKYVSNMEISFVNEVKKNCVGYFNDKNLPINMISSINEVLHLMHSYVLNNEYILQSIPMISETTIDNKEEIVLRGFSSPLFQQLFRLFPKNLDVGRTEMVVIDDKKMIMMIRDVGHALTIEITLNNNMARLEYFIPKICNIDMVNRLPGINKINENSVGATGVIEIDINELPQTLYSLISKVPTDSDMIINSRIR